MNGISAETVRELLEQSLAAWRISGTVRIAGNDAVMLSCEGAEIRVQQLSRDRAATAWPLHPHSAALATPGESAPFRWTVTVNGRKRAALSVVAVLRQLRAALEPGYERQQVRIVPAADLPA